jgi:hypothetical protein
MTSTDPSLDQRRENAALRRHVERVRYTQADRYEIERRPGTCKQPHHQHPDTHIAADAKIAQPKGDPA